MRLPPLSLHDEWKSARPFPLFVVDHFLHLAGAREAAAEFPPPDDTRWHTFNGPLEQGKQEGNAAIAGPCVAKIHDDLASDEFVTWLRGLTGIADLQADPHRTGGGIHQSGPGARLGMHVDFNVHPRDASLVRAVNLILFLADWDPGGGPDHNDWLRLGRGEERGFGPMSGRLIVFEAGDENYHGHPRPMRSGAPLRKSIPAYFYRPIRDGEQIEAHSTRFLDAEGA